MKYKNIGMLFIFGILLTLGLSTVSANTGGSGSGMPRDIVRYEQHPEKGLAIHYITVELKCRDNIDNSIILYKLTENGKTVGYVYSKGYKYLDEAVYNLAQKRNVNYIWNYKDIQANGINKKQC